jgi:hypothetical protein
MTTAAAAVGPSALFTGEALLELIELARPEIERRAEMGIAPSGVTALVLRVLSDARAAVLHGWAGGGFAGETCETDAKPASAELLSVDDVAERLEVSLQYARRRAEDWGGRQDRPGGPWLFTREDVERVAEMRGR